MKIEVDNMLTERLGIQNDKYRLITEQKERNKCFGNLNIYIPNFIYSIWNNPKSLASILLITDKKDIDNNLDHFIVHNLYENIFSSNGIQDQVIYIITLLLMEEIKNLSNDSHINLLTFLNGSPCGFILKELVQKKEVQSFFKNIIKNILKIMEALYSLNPLLFSPDGINEKIKKGKVIVENLDSHKIFKEKMKIFETIYIVALNKELLEGKYSECKDEEMKIFLKNKISDCELYKDYYSNEKLIKLMYKMNAPTIIYNYYRQSFIKAVVLIDILLDNLLLYSNTIPYYIKCICKIISIAIKKKFPEFGKVEINAYISNFFFGKLFFLVFRNPALYTLMNERLIIDKTIGNLNIIQFILTKFIQGEFFDENDNFVPFNSYFIEQMPKLLQFYENMTKVQLPFFIENLINDKLPENYIYDYFQENPNESIFYRHICFKTEILYTLVVNAYKIKDKIVFDQIVLEKMHSNIKQLERIKDRPMDICVDDFVVTDKRVDYFLISDTINNKKYENILNIKREKNHFSIKEIKKIETEEDEIKNNIIKIKNFFFSFLYNFPTLNKNNFIKDNLNNIISILKEIKDNSNLNENIFEEQNMNKMSPLLDSLLQHLPVLQQRNISKNDFLEKRLTVLAKVLAEIKEDANKNLSNNSYQKPIPIKWFLGSLIQFLPKLPQEYINNNYEKLLNELEQDITSSIKQLDFEFLSEILDHLREIEKNKYYYQNVKNIIIDIDLNKEVYKIVQKEQIPVNICFEKDELEIKPIGKTKEKKLFLFNKKEKNIACQTINDFIKNFPDLTQYESKQDLNMINVLKDMKIPEKLQIYFNIIKETLKEKKIGNNNNFTVIFDKIYDYIMEQLNDKLFPKEICKEDIKISQNCYRLAWIQPSDIIPFKKIYILDYYLPDAINYFKKINEEKSPRKKFLCIKEIYNCIYNLGLFNEDKVEGADEELPLLNYTFIKANPEKIYNNCLYLNLFIGEQKNKIEGNQLTKMLLLCESVEKITYKSLINISEEEFLQKCNLK